LQNGCSVRQVSQRVAHAEDGVGAGIHVPPEGQHVVHDRFDRQARRLPHQLVEQQRTGIHRQNGAAAAAQRDGVHAESRAEIDGRSAGRQIREDGGDLGFAACDGSVHPARHPDVHRRQVRSVVLGNGSHVPMIPCAAAPNPGEVNAVRSVSQQLFYPSAVAFVDRQRLYLNSMKSLARRIKERLLSPRGVT
jgi:hypothetical protein